MEKNNGMQHLIEKTYNNRFWITVFQLTIFLTLCIGIGLALFTETPMAQEWKEILLLVLGAFIGAYSKVIDFWFNNTERDRDLRQRAGDEDRSPDTCTCKCPDCQQGAIHQHHPEGHHK